MSLQKANGFLFIIGLGTIVFNYDSERTWKRLKMTLEKALKTLLLTLILPIIIGLFLSRRCLLYCYRLQYHASLLMLTLPMQKTLRFSGVDVSVSVLREMQCKVNTEASKPGTWGNSIRSPSVHGFPKASCRVCHSRPVFEAVLIRKFLRYVRPWASVAKVACSSVISYCSNVFRLLYFILFVYYLFSVHTSTVFCSWLD